MRYVAKADVCMCGFVVGGGGGGGGVCVCFSSRFPPYPLLFNKFYFGFISA